jgi:hypothetical protein
MRLCCSALPKEAEVGEGEEGESGSARPARSSITKKMHAQCQPCNSHVTHCTLTHANTHAHPSCQRRTLQQQQPPRPRGFLPSCPCTVHELGPPQPRPRSGMRVRCCSCARASLRSQTDARLRFRLRHLRQRGCANDLQRRAVPHPPLPPSHLVDFNTDNIYLYRMYDQYINTTSISMPMLMF